MARAMQSTAFGLVSGFLSTAVFIAAFILAGDVLTAAALAILTAIVQFTIQRNATHSGGVLIWASLVLVLGLTGLTLSGDEADAAYQPMYLTNSSYVAPNCHCRAPLQIDASAPVLPKL